MQILFIGRKRGNSQYYQRLCKELGNNYQTHVMGKPYPQALSKVLGILNWDCTSVVDKQLEIKISKRPFLKSWPLIMSIYRAKTALVERLRYLKYLHLLEKRKPSKIAIWNGNKLPNETVVAAAKQLGIGVFYFELGPMPNTTTLDPMGVNYTNSLPRNAKFFLDYEFEESPKTLPKLDTRAPNKKRQIQEHIRIEGPYFFIPFQVPNDTQIICNSHWVKSMEQLFLEVVSAHKAAKLNHIKLVFKEHPSWKGHFKELYDNYEHAIFANGNNTPELIENSSAVLTINSTVGLEALYCKKKVIVLGDACYNITGLTRSATNAQELLDTLKNIEHWDFDETLRSKYLNYLYNVYCIPGKHLEKGPFFKEHAKKVEQRILGTDSFAKSLDKV